VVDRRMNGGGGGGSYVGDDTTAAECVCVRVCVCARVCVRVCVRVERVCARVEIHTTLPFCARGAIAPGRRRVLVVYETEEKCLE